MSHIPNYKGRVSDREGKAYSLAQGTSRRHGQCSLREHLSMPLQDGLLLPARDIISQVAKGAGRGRRIKFPNNTKEQRRKERG